MTTLTAEELENVKKDSYKICQEFLGDVWGDLSISEFKFSVVSGGLNNTLYRCRLPENSVVKNPKTPYDVLVRFYGLLQEDKNVVVTETAAFVLLAERKLGPKLYGVFPNGRIEEFIQSRALLRKDYRKMYPAIARELAKIHALDVPVRKIPDFWYFYIDNGEIKKSNSPVVFCHNDLQGGNILLREDSPSEEDPRLMLIDFEWGAYNYRGFDLANQFIEWSFDYSTSEYPYFEYNKEQYPSEDEQISYIRAYLDQLVEEGIIPSTSVTNEIKVILEEVELFSMAVNLLWSIWSWSMTCRSSADFAHDEFAKNRMNGYRDFKTKYLDRIRRKGDSVPSH